MTTSHRLPEPFGLYIDRSRTLGFDFEGRHYSGLAGDSLGSALAANGVKMVSRSFKYHRPRGFLTFAGLDCNSYVQFGDEPNVQADRLVLTDGLSASALNVSGSLENDRDAYLGHFSRFLPVGFYYKTFFRPKGAWAYWEKIIRRKAGLGNVDKKTPHGYYDKAYLFADVCVIGGGPAGLSAALEAGKTGAEVILIDEEARLGGSLNYAFGAGGQERASKLAAELAKFDNVTVLNPALCTGWFADNWLAVIQGNRLYKLRAKQVVLASGSVEQPMVFRNNDLPGVILGSAVQRMIRLYGVRPGSRAVVCTGNDHGYRVAQDLRDAGVEVVAITDLRNEEAKCVEAGALAAQGLRILSGHTVYEAIPERGKRGISGAVIDSITGEGEVSGSGETLACDLIVTSVGYAPLAQLMCHCGGRMKYSDALHAFELDERPKDAFFAGSVDNGFDLEAALAEGAQSGWSAAKTAGAKVGKEPAKPGAKGAEGINYPWPIFPHPEGKDFVDFDEDQTVKDVINAVADGFEDVELMKRYTTVGMGPSQGRNSALNSVRLTNKANGRGVSGSTTTTQRPPFKPESFGHLAGRSFDPERLTAMHHRHVEAGAQMMLAGAWYRPAYYGRKADRLACIEAEARNVRNNVGMIDVSTLGGLEVRGPDAAEFMNRMYTWAYKKQKVGRARYLLMSDQTGAVVDDGVACRFSEQEFYVTATTGGVDGVYRAMLRWNAEWRLKVDVANVTGAYAGFNIAGPNSRKVLEKLDCDMDLTAEGFPYMGVREGRIAGIPVRLLRVGFVGELGYEIHMPASCGEALWDLVMEAGAEFGIKPFGVEAQRLLRLEKGHIIIGQDTDGLTTPAEADMLWAVGKKKPFFIGKRSLDIMAEARPLERKLVGFTLPGDSPVPEECVLVIKGDRIVGRVTSAARSEACGGIVGMAYVAPEDAVPGKSFNIKLEDGAYIYATVASIPFYDPDGKRQEL
ncbi:MAG: FAD-dependent oxidoreductase [Rhodovibrionaceae bacterium]